MEEIKEELKAAHQLVSSLPITGKESFIVAEILTRLSRIYEITQGVEEEKETTAEPK